MLSRDTELLCRRHNVAVQAGDGHLWCPHIDVGRGEELFSSHQYSASSVTHSHKYIVLLNMVITQDDCLTNVFTDTQTPW